MSWKFLNTLIQGLMLGGMFGLFATGLSLTFGVMRLVNLAHGDLIIMASFLAIAIVDATGLHPLLTLAVVIPVMFVFGYFLQIGLLIFTLGKDLMPPLLVTFGLSIILQNILMEIFSADTRRLNAGGLETMGIEISEELSVGVFPLGVFILTILVVWGIQTLFYKTRIGRIFRATSDDAETAQLMGIDTKKIFALALGLAMAICALAGVLLAIRTNISPTTGPGRLLFAFEAVVIGGLGNPWGTLAGGMILGIAQSIGAQIHPGAQILAGHIAFLLVLIIKPSGLFPKIKD